ncbi:MAG: hypothetical protein AAF771_05725 [Pseudomonadota bacterium]
MAEPRLTNARIREGVWEAQVSLEQDVGSPDFGAYHLEAALSDLSVSPIDGAPGQWSVRLPIPPAVIGDGVNTILVKDNGTGETLATIALVAGEPLAEDIRAEVDLLRAELDMLKRAFRRHCLEGG